MVSLFAGCSAVRSFGSGMIAGPPAACARAAASRQAEVMIQRARTVAR